MNTKLRTQISELVDSSSAPRQQVLESILEAMVHTALQIPVRGAVHNRDRRAAYRGIAYMIESKLEESVEKSWHKEKVKHMFP